MDSYIHEFDRAGHYKQMKTIANGIVLVSLLLTLDIFHTLF